MLRTTAIQKTQRNIHVYTFQNEFIQLFWEDIKEVIKKRAMLTASRWLQIQHQMLHLSLRTWPWVAIKYVIELTDAVKVKEGLNVSETRDKGQADDILK